MDTYIDLAALGKVLLVSLVAGVGLVSLFGVGLLAVSEHRGVMQDGPHSGAHRGGPGWLVVAGLSFTVVLLGAGLGVLTILE
jgi:hypothetical protein